MRTKNTKTESARSADMRITNTKSKILYEGKSLLQRFGYNGFSFQDIAQVVGVKKPSLYDHYGSKEELVLAIISDYAQKFEDWKLKVNNLSPEQKIKSVFKIFESFSCDNKKVCPVLALTIDLSTVSKPVLNEMKNFIHNWMTWLEEVIKDGQKNKIFRTDINANELSKLIYSQVMGSQLQAKILGKPNLILDSSDLVIELIKKK